MSSRTFTLQLTSSHAMFTRPAWGPGGCSVFLRRDTNHVPEIYGHPASTTAASRSMTD